MLRASFILPVTLLVGLAGAPVPLLAHCDGIDGPVVSAARKALESGNVNPVLIWIQSGDEPEIRKTFGDVVAVRKLGSGARELADRHFFETLVRLHRAGEGAPYTGIKPAGQDLGKGIPAADKAIEDGSARQLLQLLSQQVEAGVQQRFNALVAKKHYSTQDTAAGRDYVKAYVDFVHYVERVYRATTAGTGRSAPSDPAASPEHQH